MVLTYSESLSDFLTSPARMPLSYSHPAAAGAGPPCSLHHSKHEVAMIMRIVDEAKRIKEG